MRTGATLRLFPGSVASWRAIALYAYGAFKPSGLQAAAYSTTGTVAAHYHWPSRPGTAGGLAGRGCGLGSHVDDGQRWRPPG